MPTKKALKNFPIVNTIRRECFFQALDGAFGRKICVLSVLTEQSNLELSIISLNYEDMSGMRIEFEGINGDGSHYEGHYDFNNHNNCWIRQIV